MVKAMIVDAGPRKGWNTEQLLDAAAEGAAAAGAEVERVRLYDEPFLGCKSCFACKVKNSRSIGVCAVRDWLRPVLERAAEADVIIIGSPIYYSQPTGVFRAFMERLCFPWDSYSKDESGTRIRYIPKDKRCGLVWTMNCPKQFAFGGANYDTLMGISEREIGRVLGHCESVWSCDTYQFRDYDRYEANMFDEEHKAQHRDEQFPVDLADARAMGERLVLAAAKEVA
ncbi:MAG: flavodoxin family protein [Coriobacteriales bacterium]|nr:flavodoxin family protein [Coriobacteriales bacterium]